MTKNPDNKSGGSDEASFSQNRMVTLWLKETYWLRDRQPHPEPPREAVGDSYLNQLFRFQLDGLELALIGANQPVTDLPEPLPVDSELARSVLHRLNGFWISGWHPNGEPTATSNLAEREALLDSELERQLPYYPELKSIPMSAMQQRGSWVEGGRFVTGIDEFGAMQVGRALGQLAIVQFDSGKYLVWPIDPKICASRDDLRVVQLEAAPCPMLMGTEVKLPCNRYGGPFGSRAIAAFGYWSQQRTLAVSRVGCRVCEAGDSPFPVRDPSEFSKSAAASRHGTATSTNRRAFAAGENVKVAD